MPTPLATQAPDDLGLKATLQWERPCGDMGLDTALEGKEPGCGSGWRDRPGTEGTTVGQPTQGREWCFIGLEAAGYPASRHGDFPLRRGVMFILFSSTMDQGGSSLGLEPFVRCPVDKLLSMNSVRAF